MFYDGRASQYLVYHVVDMEDRDSFFIPSLNLPHPLPYNQLRFAHYFSSPPTYTSLSEPPRRCLGPDNFLAHCYSHGGWSHGTVDCARSTYPNRVGILLTHSPLPQQRKIMHHFRYVCIYIYMENYIILEIKGPAFSNWPLLPTTSLSPLYLKTKVLLSLCLFSHEHLHQLLQIH